MLYQQDIFVGVDVAAGKRPYTTAVLNLAGELLSLEPCSMEEFLKFTGGYQIVQVAINSPRHINGGKEIKTPFNLISETPYGEGNALEIQVYSDLRRASARRIAAMQAKSNLPARIRNGFRLYDHLPERNSVPVQEGIVIEVNAQVSFSLLLGRTPLLKSSTEGRIQRQLALIAQGIKLKDPMNYFEELTKYRLLQGLLPHAMLYSARQLDAIVSAFMARLAFIEPAAVQQIGDGMGGFVYCPARKHQFSNLSG